MITKLKKSAALLMLSLLLAGCQSFNPPSIVQAPQIPPPPEELMLPLPSSPVNVQESLSYWTATLKSWQERQKLCRTTPEKCA